MAMMGSFGSVSDIPGGIEIAGTSDAAGGKKGEVSLATVNPQTGTYLPVPLDDGRTLYFNKATGIAYFSEPGGAKTYFENVWLQPYELENCEKDDVDSCSSVSSLPVASYQNTLGKTGEFSSETPYGDQAYNRIKYNIIMGDTQDLSAQTISQTSLAKFASKLNGMTSAQIALELNLINDPLVLMQLLNVDPPLNETAREAIRTRLKSIKEEKRRRRSQDNTEKDQNAKKMQEMEEQHLLPNGKPTELNDTGTRPSDTALFGNDDSSGNDTK